MNSPLTATEVAGTKINETELQSPIHPLVFTAREELQAISQRIATHIDKTQNVKAKLLLDIASDLIRRASYYIDIPNT